MAASIRRVDASKGELGPVRGVAVFGGPIESAGLAMTVTRLGYVVDPANAASASTGIGSACAPLAAAVVDDGTGRFALTRNLAARCPVILISSDTSFAFRLAAARSGVRALIRPPVNPIELAEWLALFAAESVSVQTSVVIVDDDPLMAEINAAILRTTGMRVDTVSEASQAVSTIERLRPDLVLMDLNMPEVDGVTLAQMIRQSRQFASLPIIFLSGERDEERQLAARRLGGDDFIAKPVIPDRLIALVSLRAERSRLLRSMIERDGLTGLYDHRRFGERLTHEVARSRRARAQLCFVMLDIDRFKAVNDTHGHGIGDAVIRTLAHALVTGLRSTDIVGRWGGEEFGIILPDTDPAGAMMIIDKIRAAFGRLPFEAREDTLRVTFSGGVASLRDFDEVTSLVEAADRALYRAKDAGRDRIVHEIRETKAVE